MEQGTTWNANPIVREISVNKKSRQLQAEKRKAAIAAWFSTDTDSEDDVEELNEPIDEEEIFGTLYNQNNTRTCLKFERIKI
jgi:hypothetical protein